MNLAKEPTALARTYRNSETSLSVVFAARLDVDGFGGSAARKSPYAGPSCSLRSTGGLLEKQEPVLAWKIGRRLTVDVLALCHVGIVGAGEEAIPVPANNALNVPARRVSLSGNSRDLVRHYPLLTLKKRPSMLGKAGSGGGGGEGKLS